MIDPSRWHAKMTRIAPTAVVTSVMADGAFLELASIMTIMPAAMQPSPSIHPTTLVAVPRPTRRRTAL